MLSLKLRNLLPLTILALFTSGLTAKIKLNKGDDICLVGAGMGSRMIHSFGRGCSEDLVPI